jgi:hypothetical protein
MYPVTSSTDSTGSYKIDPTPSNNYCVNFEDHYQVRDKELDKLTVYYWSNPYARTQKSIKPYVPCDSIALTSLTFFEKINTSGLDCCICDSKDAFSTLFIILDPKDLVNFSETSKCCYLATKTDIIWQYQLKKLLPNVCCLSKFTCTFTPEQQFQIVFKKIHDRKKPFIAQLEHVREKTKEIAIIAIDKIELIMRDAVHLSVNDKFFSQIKYDLENNQKSIEELEASISEYVEFLMQSEDPINIDEKQRKIYNATNWHQNRLKCYSNDEKDCLFALNSIPVMEFDIQEKFEIIIQSSETAKQNISLGIEPQVEEVEDDYFGSYGSSYPQTQADSYGSTSGSGA